MSLHNIHFSYLQLMFIPGLLVQFLHRLGPRVFCEEFGVQLVFSFVVSLHLAERYQVTRRWKFTLFSTMVNSPGEKIFQIFQIISKYIFYSC